MLEKGAWLVPTLLAPIALIRAIDDGARVAAAVERKARTVVDIHAAAVKANALQEHSRVGLGPAGDILRSEDAGEQGAESQRLDELPGELDALVAAHSQPQTPARQFGDGLA